MNLPALSTGCLKDIMSNVDYEGQPVLQVLGSKRISGGSAERYRVLLSDGKYLQSFSMLSTQLNPLVTNGELTEFAIIKVNQHITSVVNKNENDESRRVLIVIALDVLKKGAEVGKKIGDPVSLTEMSKQTTSAIPSNTSVTTASPGPSQPQNRPQKSNKSLSQSNGCSYAPIIALVPYQNSWTIKARVTSKSAIRHWSNAKGEGKLFSMDLMDESGQIRATAFRDIVDQYYDLIEVDKVYRISKGQIKTANKQFSNIKNDYELTFTNDTIVELCEEDSADVPIIKYDFVSIADISQQPKDAIVDVIGVCRDVGELQSFTAKSTGKELKKREITIVDESEASINLTLWNTEAENFKDFSQPVLLVKSCKISEFGGGKSLAFISSTVLKRNPDLPEGHRLRGWFDNGGGREVRQSLSAQASGGGFNTEWLTLHEVKERNLGLADKPDYFQMKGTIQMVREANLVYKACANGECKKKVVDMENGHYRCEVCNKEVPNYKYRLLANLSIADWTSNRWATAFGSEVEKILGKTSDEVGLIQENSQSELSAFLQSQHFKQFIFKCRIKMETYGDTQRNKISIQSVSPINYTEYNDYLIKNIQRLTGIEKI